MKRFAFAFAALATLLSSTAAIAETEALIVWPTPIAAWVQLVPGGGAEARAVVRESYCPTLVVDGVRTQMTLRGDKDASFARTCAAAIPAGARKAEILHGSPLPVPAADPQRILVLGDTGCRIKGTTVQACNDPKAWPFAGLSRAATNLKPDLVIHLGDYLYRESPCPEGNAGCVGSPHGDNWESWNADFFAPAAPLLAAAPWVIVRGNHEDCARSGLGFLRLLGPVAFDPAAPCTDHLSPYAVPVGSQTLAVMDNAIGDDQHVDDRVVGLFHDDFETLKAIANIGTGRELWLAAHRPIWAAVSGPLGLPVGGSVNLIRAAGDLSAFAAISLMLSGHIHTFEAINYEATLPPQIVAGHGGDNLDVTPVNLKGTIFQGDSGVHVKDGLSVHGFGFLMMTRAAGSEGWTIQLYDSDGTPETQCQFEAGRVFCLQPR